MKISLPSIEITKLNLFLFFSVLVVPFIYTTAVPDPSLSPRLLALDVVIFVFLIALLFYVFRNYKTNTWEIRRSRILLFYVLYLIFAAISIFNAANQYEAFFEWLKTFSFFAFLIIATIFFHLHQNPIRLIVKTVIIFSFVLSLRGVYEIITTSADKAFDHQASYLIRAFSSNRNLFSEILFLCLPFTSMGIYLFRSWWRFAAMVASGIAFILITMLLTRSVWAAIILSSLVTILVLLLFRKHFHFTSSVKRGLGLTVIIVIILLVTGVIIFSRLGDIEVFEKQFYWVTNYKFGSSLERIELWKKTIQMGMDHMITGVGQGNWRIIFPSYSLENLRSESGIIFFQRPHNDFLWIFAENGLPGFIAYLFIFLSAIYYLLKMIMKETLEEDKLISIGLLFGLVGYIMIAFVSFPKERVEHQIFLHLFLALIIAKYADLSSDKNNGFRSKKRLFTFLMLLTIGSAVSIYYVFQRVDSEISIKKAYVSRMEQHWENVIPNIDRAIKPLTNLDSYSTPLAWYRGEAQFLLNDKKSALISFEEAYKVNPNHLHVLNNLGTCYELDGNHQLAKKYYQKALKISPRFEESSLNLCAVYYNEGEIDSALLLLRNIPDTSSNQKYQIFRRTLLLKKLMDLNKSSVDQPIARSIQRIISDDKWIMKIYRQSLSENIDFDKAVYNEVIYLMESMDSTITARQANIYRKKFNLME
ncbi:MAG: O-antigen ligase family protein [Bacteroidetes bacterium]|nr:O-antigen ligase family protein [Bacteroidota bacterium]